VERRKFVAQVEFLTKIQRKCRNIFQMALVLDKSVLGPEKPSFFRIRKAAARRAEEWIIFKDSPSGPKRATPQCPLLHVSPFFQFRLLWETMRSCTRCSCFWILNYKLLRQITQECGMKIVGNCAWLNVYVHIFRPSTSRDTREPRKCNLQRNDWDLCNFDFLSTFWGRFKRKSEITVTTLLVSFDKIEGKMNAA